MATPYRSGLLPTCQMIGPVGRFIRTVLFIPTSRYFDNDVHVPAKFDMHLPRGPKYFQNTPAGRRKVSIMTAAKV
jgi:hypothetical protein